MDFIKTRSGSTYEIDLDRTRIRRVYDEQGTDPAPDVGDDWRVYEILQLHDPGDGDSLLIYWGADAPPPRYTLTSPVVSWITEEAEPASQG